MLRIQQNLFCTQPSYDEYKANIDEEYEKLGRKDWYGWRLTSGKDIKSGSLYNVVITQL